MCDVLPISICLQFTSVNEVTVQDALDKIVPEGRHYRHLDEGLDDMPAHVKVRTPYKHVLRYPPVFWCLKQED